MNETEQEQNTVHPVRITNHNKIKNYVSFALDFFAKNERTPIVFHTLPPGYLTSKDEHQRKKTRLDVQPSTSEQDNAEQRESTKSPAQQGASSSKTVTDTIPRLVTVVEIIKREFLKNLALKQSLQYAGLHQYTEIGCLEDLQKSGNEITSAASAGDRGGEDDFNELFDERAKEVVEALSGKNHVKRKRTPYMKITLSLSAIPALAEQGATYQAPAVRKLSKSAKSRAKKRERKRQVQEEVEGSDAEEMSE